VSKSEPGLEKLRVKLSTTRRELLRAADWVPAEQWRAAPEEGRWSAGETIAHLMMVERAVLSKADRVSQKEPKRWPFYRRFHMPFQIVEKRWMRRKAPLPLVPELVGEKEEMLAEFREVRERTLAFLEETKGRDLSVYRWAHPFLGTLNVYEWLQFVACHEVRHRKQVREIAEGLPKSVGSLRK
jgi:uncharacterized damage-inducible protein DinB